MFKKLLIAVVALGCLGLAGFGFLAWRPAIAPVALPAPGSFAPELIARGEALAGGGYCAACHTAKGGEKFAGGYAMATRSARSIRPISRQIRIPESAAGPWRPSPARCTRESRAMDRTFSLHSRTTISPRFLTTMLKRSTLI